MVIKNKNAMNQVTALEPLHNDSLNKIIMHQILVKINIENEENAYE